MTIELFSLWGGQRGWLSQRKGGYQVSAVLNEQGIWYTGIDPKRLEREFNRACRRIVLRRLLPFLTPPASRLSV